MLVFYWREIQERSLGLPLYEYKCRKCGHGFEKIENHSALATKKCPRCGGRAERQISSSAFQFKGSGWYVTDYPSKTSGPSAPESSDSAAAAKPKERPAEPKQTSEKGTPKKKK
jgi:putative FmdB family regulatory protein